MEDDTPHFLYHCPCPNCGSSDALSVYSDGHGYCFSCNTYFKGKNNSNYEKGAKRKMSKECISIEDLKGEFKAIPSRGLTEDTCRKYKYYIGSYKGAGCLLL